MLFWTGVHPNRLSFKEVLVFSEYSDDVFEEFAEVIEQAVASGVAEVVNNIDL